MLRGGSGCGELGLGGCWDRDQERGLLGDQGSQPLAPPRPRDRWQGNTSNCIDQTMSSWRFLTKNVENNEKNAQVENYRASSFAISPLKNVARVDFEARCPLKSLFSRDNSLPPKHCCPSPQCTFAKQNSFVFINFLSSYLDLFQYSECIRERERENSGRFSGNSKFFFTEIEIIWQATVKYF